MPAATAGAVVCPPATRRVNDAEGLRAALQAARGGDVITLADGVYRGSFTAAAKASPSAPIYLCGGRGAVLDGGSTERGYVLHLDGAAFWRVSGFSVRDGQKGVVADRTTGTIIDGLDVGNLGDEGIHLRSFSTQDTVQHNAVHDTGLHNAKFGEGIYVGSARSNWCTQTSCAPDRSDDNLVLDNSITRTTAENLDIKEGTTGGTVRGNRFSGLGLSAADSWIDVKGNGWTIEQNTGTNSGASSMVDGFQTHQILSGWGMGNVFRANVGTIDAPGFGLHLTPPSSNVVACDNKLADAGKGLANVPCVADPPAASTLVTPSALAASPAKHHRHHH